MTRWIAALALVASCQRGTGASPSTVPSEALDGRSPAAAAASGDPAGAGTAPATAPAAPAAPAELTAELACKRFDALAGEGCDWTQRFPSEFREAGTCLNTLTSWLSPSTPEHGKLQRTVNCWALECDAAAACMVSIHASSPPPAPRRCGDEGTAPIYVDAAAWSARRGAATKRFADLQTTVEAPVEVCGIQGELEWMTRVTCNDGTNPYGTLEVAHDSRDGWFARGGRCNSILDRFSVRCPEATYQVHVDRYVCPEP